MLCNSNANGATIIQNCLVEDPKFGHPANRILDRIVVFRILVGLSMISYIIFGIITGVRVPFVKRYCAYLYFGVAATVPLIYWTRPQARRHAVSVAQFALFTIYLLGNWSYTLYIRLHYEGSITKGWIWLFVWAVEVYVEGALLRGHPFDPYYPVTALRAYLKSRELLIHELEKTKSQLFRVNRLLTLNALADTITHEISQPLAATIVNAEAAKRWLTAGNIENTQQALTRAVEDGHRASDVVTSFHQLLKEGEPLRIPVNITDLIEQALDIHNAIIQANGVKIRIADQKLAPTIMCDPVQIKQVFLNLIANAIDALGESAPKNRKLVVRYENTKDGQATISIEDNGVGISNPDQIWNLFYTTKATGTGMGLFISRMIVEAHGGTLTARSILGRTKFNVSLPIGNSRHEFDGVRGGKRPVTAVGNRELAELGWASR